MYDSIYEISKCSTKKSDKNEVHKHIMSVPWDSTIYDSNQNKDKQSNDYKKYHLAHQKGRWIVFKIGKMKNTLQNGNQI